MTLRSTILLALACSLPGLAAGAPVHRPGPAAQDQDVPTLEQARALLEAGDVEKAIEAYRAIVKAQPENGMAHHMLGYALHGKGDLDAALEAHKTAAKFADVRAVSLYNCACVYSLKGEKDEAIEYLGKAVEAGFDRAEHAATDGDLDNVRSDPRFEKVMAAMRGETPAPQEPAQPVETSGVPTMAEARARLDAGDPLGAAKAYARIAEAEPDNGLAHHMAGYCLHVGGKLDEALKMHLEAARFDSVKAMSLYNAACVHALQGRKDQAFEYLAKAREAGFDQPEQLRADPDMDGLRSDPRFAALVASMDEDTGTEPAPASPAPERLFDFWVGEWSMTAGDEVYGTSRVQATLGGNGLRQTSLAPGGEVRSESTYVYDAAAGQWKQVWMDRDGNLAVLTGGPAGDGRIVMTMVSMNGEPEVVGRSVFSNLRGGGSDGERGFDYEWQTSDDGGQTWYHGTAVRFTPTGGRTR